MIKVKYPELLKRYIPPAVQPRLISCKYDWSEMLKRYFEDKESISKIAREMGCHYTTVHTVIKWYAKVPEQKEIMRPIKIEDHKTKVYDFEIRVGLGMPGSMALSVTTEELEEIVKQAKEVLAFKRDKTK